MDQLGLPSATYKLICGDVVNELSRMSEDTFDLVLTSPPYNIGKSYEQAIDLSEYLDWQRSVISAIDRTVKGSGSICYQVGNYVLDGVIEPLDILLYPMFKELGYKLRNRIVWHFGHGLHARTKFSNRYEVVMWFTKSNKYTFNLDNVRIPSKYPLKRSYKGPNSGQVSANPKGKNPEDVWFIPNVKANHVEKLDHPCQFPIGLAERLILGLTNPGDLVLDPFCGVGSSGIASLMHGRRYVGVDIEKRFVSQAQTRIDEFLAGRLRYRPHDKPIYDHKKSKLSGLPQK